VTWGIIPYGSGAYGTGVVVFAGAPTTINDEGGVELLINGAFPPATRATITINGAACPLPTYAGGVSDASLTPGTGPIPITSSDGTSVRCVAPPLPVGGPYDIIVSTGGPPVTLANALNVVRRDFFTTLHSIRKAFPTPPVEYEAAGPRELTLESFTGPLTSGETVPALEALLHTIAAGLLEFSGILYTRLVPAPWEPGDRVRVWSDAAGDVTQSVTVTGYAADGFTAQSETLALAGLGVVVGALFWSRVDRAVLDLSAVGTGTVADEQGTAPERIVITTPRLAKSAGALHEGDTNVVVEGNSRFASTGTLALEDELVVYTSTTTTPTLNSFTLAAPGVVGNHDNNEVVADASDTQSGIGLARRALMVDYAEGEQLDAVGRRWGGFGRLAGMGNSNYRDLIKGSAGSAHGTLNALEGFLDLALGAGTYEIIEEVIDFTEVETTVDAPPLYAGQIDRTASAMDGYPAEVWFDFGATVFSPTNWFGKTYLCGAEPQPSTAATTVDITHTPITVYGVYLATDTLRTNNLMDFAAVDGATNVANPTRFTSATGAFVAGDVGSPLSIGGAAPVGTIGPWVVDTRIDANNVTLRGRNLEITQAGATAGISGTAFRCPTSWPDASGYFSADDVGKDIQITAPAAAIGDYPITAYISPKHVVCGGGLPAAPAAGVDIQFRLRPNFPTQGGLTWRIHRGSVVAVTVTFIQAVAHPVNLIVDYTHVLSAQVLTDDAIANNPAGLYYPFYVGDESAWLRSVLDMLTAAGVIPRFGTPPP